MSTQIYTEITGYCDQALSPWMPQRSILSRVIQRPSELSKWIERAQAVVRYVKLNKEVVFFRFTSSLSGFFLTPGLYTGMACGLGSALFIHLALNQKEWEQAKLTRLQVLVLGIIQLALFLLFVKPQIIGPQVRQLLPYASGFLSAFYGPFIALRKA